MRHFAVWRFSLYYFSYFLKKGKCLLMSQSQLDEAIYQKYITPTEREPKRYVGPEFEFPIVNLSKKPVDIPASQGIVKDFSEKFGFSERRQDDNGNFCSLTEPKTGDNLSFDCSYNTLELSFGKEENIHVLAGRFHQYFTFLQERFRQTGQLLTGLGANPYYRYNEYDPIASPRYRMLKRFLHSYKQYGGIPYHDIPDFDMIGAAAQVQLDVGKDNIIQTINTFNRLEPLKAVLFANSLYDETPDILINRDRFWKYSSQGYNPHNLDMYAIELHSMEEYIEYVKTQSLYCVEKDGKYLHFKPILLTQYMAAEQVTGEYFENGEWKNHTFRPAIEDLAHLRTFKFEDLTYRGTIEYRSACEQPISEIFTVAAFHAGLAERVDELEELLAADTVIYGHGYNPIELRERFVRRELPDFVDKKGLSDLLLRVLELAGDGLTDRGFGEETFLSPLYHRAERLTNPALEMLHGLEHGDSLESWIERYS